MVEVYKSQESGHLEKLTLKTLQKGSWINIVDPTPYELREVSSLTRDDLILERLKDIKDGQHELKAELQTTKRELNDRMDKLDGRMDRIENEMRNVVRHSQIMTASVVGIALAVVYFVFTH